MIGVTLNGGGAYSAMAEEARERFMWSTGLNCVVVHTQAEKNYAAKLELLSMFNQTIVYFDADLWFIQKCDLSEFDNRDEFLAVLDPGINDEGHFPAGDCKVLGIDPQRYFNSGLMIFNQRHAKAMAKAAELIQKVKLNDFGEQSYINAGVQLTGTPLQLIDQSFNFIPYAAVLDGMVMNDMDNPLTIHAAGYDPNWKHDMLRSLFHRYGGHYESHHGYHAQRESLGQ